MDTMILPADTSRETFADRVRSHGRLPRVTDC
jgi:hypothetical protein